MSIETTEQLNAIAGNYSGDIINGWEKLYRLKRRYAYAQLRAHAVAGPCAEYGCADGAMTELLAADFPDLTVVDGSTAFLRATAEKVGRRPGISYVESYFENYVRPGHFSTIFLCHILEHLEDPVGVLRRAAGNLAPGGRLLILVPNALSLHRMAGVRMGMLSKPDDLNDQDRKLGHLRVYTPSSLRDNVSRAGLTEAAFGGIMVKPLSNRQIESQWNDSLIQAFLTMGEDFPEISSEIFLVAERPAV